MTIDPPTLTGDRLRLDPLRVDDAAEMAAVLADPALYRFTGGEPPDVATLRRRYVAGIAGRSPDGTERWLNWIVRRRAEGDPIGYVQATIGAAPEARAGEIGTTADVAWVVGVPWQGRGHATEAARLMVHWLVAPEPAGAGVSAITAHVRADHQASGAVAAAVGLRPTDRVEDGEVVWRADALEMRLARLAAWEAELEAIRGRAGTWEGGRQADGTIQVPYVVPSDRLLAFVREMAGLGWVHPFDWRAWAASPAGRRLLDVPETIAEATADDLGRLLTTIVRADRFSEGQLLGAADSGVLAAIARRAATLVAEERRP